MNKLLKTLALSALGIGALSAHAAATETFLVEAEAFQFLGDWGITGKGGQKIIFAPNSSKASPTTVVKVNADGVYAVWTSAIDYATSAPATRRYGVSVNGQEMPVQGGTHKREGLYWQKLGEVELPKGDAVISINPKTAHMRADAVLLTTDMSFDPNEALKTSQARAKIRRAPLEVEYSFDLALPAIEPLKESKSGKVFEIKNDKYKIQFAEKKDAQGGTVFERSALTLKNGKWIKLAPFAEEALYLIYHEKPGYQDGYYVSWNSSSGKIKAKTENGVIELTVPPINPYAIGKGEILRPQSIKKIDEKTLQIAYPNGVTGKISLGEHGGAAKFEVSAKADKQGYYSFCFIGGNSAARDAFKQVQLPAIYMETRIMPQPKLVPNRVTSQPLALVEYPENGESIVNAVVADPANLPFGEWSMGGNSLYGFTLASPINRVQPAIFQPILGGRDSFKKEGEEIKASWYLLNFAGNWTDGMECANENVFAGSALREAYDVSFSEAIANIAAYMKNQEASGWSPMHKARWNVEAADTGTQASPLSELSVALLTDDEDYYRNISLPSIEFTLSRMHSHFSPGRKIDGPWFRESMTGLAVPSPAWTGDYYAGVNTMLGGGNTWMKEFYNTEKYMKTPSLWNELLGLYIAEPDKPELLEQAKKNCDQWLSRVFDKRTLAEPDMEWFINVSLYPYWWYLPELYKLTGDKKYLDYAEKGAFYSLAAMWSYPTPPAGEVTINKDNLVRGVGHVWWKGLDFFRLGKDLSDSRLELVKKDPKFEKLNLKSYYVVPEKKVDAMKVSRIGLGIEQHTTYLQMDGDSNILMPGWAPEMLKVYQYTGRDILLKYSRHAIIGRYSNFLGYYIRDYTDIQHDPQYPYVGPDVTTFYYHHAPCHFGQSVDYLMTQIEIASKEKISFPYVRQQGYVWFTDRIFGKSGKVFGDAARPLLNMGAVKIGSPKVSSLLARGADSLWVILLNDSDKPAEVSVKFDAANKALKGVKDAPIALYDAQGLNTGKTLSLLGDNTVKIPPMGLVAAKLQADAYQVERPVAPLPEGDHKVFKNIAEGWGDLHVFRIRGPFGKDSVFAILTGGYCKKNALAELAILQPGAQKLSVSEYPFEFSVYPLDADKDIVLNVSIKEAGLEKANASNITLSK